MPRKLRLLLFLGALNLFPLPAFAQRATLSGTVIDQSGAVVPGVSVTLVNVQQGLKREARTNDRGYFVLPLLPPGTYSLTAELLGFNPHQVKDLVLNVGDEIALRIRMDLARVGESVEVVAERERISTSPAVSTVVDRQFVENIPLNGRSLQSLITLTPGVVPVRVPSILASGQFSVNGQRADANYFTVDGVSANVGISQANQTPAAQTSGSLPVMTTFGTTQSLVSLDALQEFKIQTSTYSAEYGRQPGGQVSMVTRSGTNELHGSLFDYLRNDMFDAKDWFANANQQPKPPEKQNDFGGTLAGPVVLPRLYDGHNRTFFFLSYEGLRFRLPQFALTNVPSIALRQDAPSVLQPILNGFPIPNGRDLGNGLAEFTASYSDPSSLNAGSLRIDHTINSKWTVFGRYNFARSETDTRLSSQTLNRITISRIENQAVTLGATAVLTASLSNDFRANYTDNHADIAFPLDNFGGATPPPGSVLIPGQFSFLSTQALVLLNFPGNTGRSIIGVTDGEFVSSQRQLNLVDTVSWLVGPHRLKFGLDYRRLTPILDQPFYTLNATFQSQQQVASAIAGSGVAVAVARARPLYTNFSAYAQDTWKLSRRMTLDIGLRLDVNPAPGEGTENHPLALSGIADLAMLALAPNGTPIWKTTYNNFGPRLGAAYDLRQRPGRETVVRGGIGVFYDTGQDQGSTPFNGYPFRLSRSLSNVTFPLSPTQVAPPTLPSVASVVPPYGNIVAFDPNLKLPYTLQWSFAVQQALSRDQGVTVSYVGAAGRRLLQQRQLTLGTVNPKFTTVMLTTNNATSDYNALQAQFQRRLSHGLQALVSYTWSHTLDEDSADDGAIVPVRGNAAFDVRHALAAAVTYDVPTPRNRLLGVIAGRWSVDTSVHAQSAAPVDITGSQFLNPADGSLVAARANVVPGVPRYVDDPTVPGGRRINSAAFSIPAARQLGNLGRNVVRGFGAWQVDLALRRHVKLTTKVYLQFRAEAFNLLNHPNFGAIQTTLTAANFGQATNMLNRQLGGLNPLYQIGGPRSFQFAIKVLF